jgi:hypothetical protein
MILLWHNLLKKLALIVLVKMAQILLLKIFALGNDKNGKF